MHKNISSLWLNLGAIRQKLRGVYFDPTLSAWQRYLILIYIVLPFVLLSATVVGFMLSVYYQGWSNFRYELVFVPAPYQPGEIIHHYK